MEIGSEQCNQEKKISQLELRTLTNQYLTYIERETSRNLYSMLVLPHLKLPNLNRGTRNKI